MKYLLDTHALLWWLFDDPKLSPRVRAIVADSRNDIYASSAWEIATKHRLGKLSSAKVLVQDIAGWVDRAGFTELPVTTPHAQRAGIWPQSHRDPFDRMLALLEELPLLSSDTFALDGFGIGRVW